MVPRLLNLPKKRVSRCLLRRSMPSSTTKDLAKEATTCATDPDLLLPRKNKRSRQALLMRLKRTKPLLLKPLESKLERKPDRLRGKLLDRLKDKHRKLLSRPKKRLLPLNLKKPNNPSMNSSSIS